MRPQDTGENENICLFVSVDLVWDVGLQRKPWRTKEVEEPGDKEQKDKIKLSAVRKGANIKCKRIRDFSGNQPERKEREKSLFKLNELSVQ